MNNKLINKIIDYNYGEFGKEFGDTLVDLKNENERLNNIINEAIEYINEMCLCSDGYANYGDDLRPEHIVNILKGDNK